MKETQTRKHKAFNAEGTGGLLANRWRSRAPFYVFYRRWILRKDNYLEKKGEMCSKRSEIINYNFVISLKNTQTTL